MSKAPAPNRLIRTTVKHTFRSPICHTLPAPTITPDSSNNTTRSKSRRPKTNSKPPRTALTAANNSVITSEADSNTSGEQLDKQAYTDADSLINACISAKAYIKSKYGTKGQPYLNIGKTRFELPSRLRKKK